MFAVPSHPRFVLRYWICGAAGVSFMANVTARQASLSGRKALIITSPAQSAPVSCCCAAWSGWRYYHPLHRGESRKRSVLRIRAFLDFVAPAVRQGSACRIGGLPKGYRSFPHGMEELDEAYFLRLQRANVQRPGSARVSSQPPLTAAANCRCVTLSRNPCQSAESPGNMQRRRRTPSRGRSSTVPITIH